MRHGMTQFETQLLFAFSLVFGGQERGEGTARDQQSRGKHEMSSLRSCYLYNVLKIFAHFLSRLEVAFV